MDTINTLKRLVKESSIIPMEIDSYNKRSYILTEPKSDYALKIVNPPDDTLVLKCDNFPDTSNFFKGDHRECKRADYIIFSGAAACLEGRTAWHWPAS